MDHFLPHKEVSTSFSSTALDGFLPSFVTNDDIPNNDSVLFYYPSSSTVPDISETKLLLRYLIPLYQIIPLLRNLISQIEILMVIFRLRLQLQILIELFLTFPYLQLPYRLVLFIISFSISQIICYLISRSIQELFQYLVFDLLKHLF